MALKLTLLVVVLAVLVLYVHAQDVQDDDSDAASEESLKVKCKKNEEYLQCGNKCDERQCDPKKDQNQNCLTVCQPGCYCKKGKFRNDYGNCVPKGMCFYKNYIG